MCGVQAVYGTLQFGRLCAFDGLIGELLSIAEEAEGRHGLDTQADGRALVPVHVHGQEADTSVFLTQGFKDGLYAFARAAPHGVEVHHHQTLACLAHLGLEVPVAVALVHILANVRHLLFRLRFFRLFRVFFRSKREKKKVGRVTTKMHKSFVFLARVALRSL